VAEFLGAPLYETTQSFLAVAVTLAVVGKMLWWPPVPSEMINLTLIVVSFYFGNASGRLSRRAPER
jgi:hypothetical protein